MPDRLPDFEPQTLWQSQPREHDPMTIAAIHEKARVFQTRIRRRNLIEYVACLVAIAGYAPTLLQRGNWMMQAGAGLVIAGVVFIAWQLHLRASAAALPDGREALIDFHRRELTRQRDALRSIAVWYIAPVVPGFALLTLGMWFRVPPSHRSVEADHLAIALMGVIAALVFLVIWLLNQRGAERLQRRIDELD